MSNELLGIFAFVFLIILVLMTILIPIVIIFNRRYLKRLDHILRELPGDAKNILKEDIKNEAEKSFIYRFLGENLFKEDDFLNRLFTDDTFKIYLKESDLNQLNSLKKRCKTLVKCLVFLLLFGLIGASVGFMFFS
jgi:hypothetical protein